MAERRDDFFAEVENTRPFLKMGAQGFAGAGKTYTLALIAAGLHKRIGSEKPVVIFDTERSSKFLKPFFRKLGIKAVRKESRALVDFVEAIDRCEQGAADILILDSVSHLWENFVEAFKAERRISELRFQHWGVLKPLWKTKFADRFVTSGVHILMTGRAAFEYGIGEKDPETGRREIIKTGVKMRVEGETAYEPDILIEMARFEEMDKRGKKEVWREATVLKDRSNTIDGRVFKNPTYENFVPAIEYLMDEARAEGVPEQGDDQALVRDADRARAQEPDVMRKVLLEEIEALMVSAAPGQTAKEKKWKGDVLQLVFNTGSWTKVELLTPEQLADGKARVAEIVRAVLAEREDAKA